MPRALEIAASAVLGTQMRASRNVGDGRADGRRISASPGARRGANDGLGEAWS